jgi:hypothetical protein
MIVLLPFLLVILASYVLMRWAGYDRAGAFLFSLCSPVIFLCAGGAFMVVGAPLSFEVVHFLRDLGFSDALTRDQASLWISACGYIAGFYVIAGRIRAENKKDTAKPPRPTNDATRHR